MKTFVRSALILIFLTACSGQRKDGRESLQSMPDEKGVPSFEIKEEIHNFGTLRAGEVALFTFEYRNNGSGNLEIKGAESGCSCLTVEPDKKMILPGDTGRIKVIFDTSGLYGKQFQSFRVFSSRQGIMLDLAVAAEVVNDNIEVK